ncbi:MAG: hypothetical protein JW717_11945 [Marinilabiliaceae bacterium]|nr:hypothetical protein [Marinilabiliaceae bacterium]
MMSLLQNKTVLFLLLFFMGSYILKSQEIVVKQKNGEIQSDLLSGVQKVTLSGGKFVIDLKSETNVVYNISDIQNVVFDNVISGLKLINNVENVFFYDKSNSCIIVNNLTMQKINLIIYSLNGIIQDQRFVTEVYQSISLHKLPKGIYIVSFNNQFLKIVK